jgi:hypothetical protein
MVRIVSKDSWSRFRVRIGDFNELKKENYLLNNAFIF